MLTSLPAEMYFPDRMILQQPYHTAKMEPDTTKNMVKAPFLLSDLYTVLQWLRIAGSDSVVQNSVTGLLYGPDMNGCNQAPESALGFRSRFPDCGVDHAITEV